MIDRATAIAAPDTVAAGWLAALQGVADTAAHELRNALNGVAVNVEVVRSRSERGAVAAGALASFAASAAEQVELAVSLSEALLHLARPARVPLDLHALTQDLRVLLAPMVMRGNASGSLEADTRGLAPLGSTDVIAVEAARCVVAATMLGVARAGGTVRAIAKGDRKLVVEGEGGERVALPDDLPEIAARAGIALEIATRRITLTFSAAQA